MLFSPLTKVAWIPQRVVYLRHSRAFIDRKLRSLSSNHCYSTATAARVTLGPLAKLRFLAGNWLTRYLGNSPVLLKPIVIRTVTRFPHQYSSTPSPSASWSRELWRSVKWNQVYLQKHFQKISSYSLYRNGKETEGLKVPPLSNDLTDSIPLATPIEPAIVQASSASSASSSSSAAEFYSNSSSSASSSGEFSNHMEQQDFTIKSSQTLTQTQIYLVFPSVPTMIFSGDSEKHGKDWAPLSSSSLWEVISSLEPLLKISQEVFKSNGKQIWLRDNQILVSGNWSSELEARRWLSKCGIDQTSVRVLLESKHQQEQNLCEETRECCSMVEHPEKQLVEQMLKPLLFAPPAMAARKYL